MLREASIRSASALVICGSADMQAHMIPHDIYMEARTTDQDFQRRQHLEAGARPKIWQALLYIRGSSLDATNLDTAKNGVVV